MTGASAQGDVKAAWFLKLLGEVRLGGESGEVNVSPRLAALLALLALDAPVSRTRLAAWLWPDAPAPTARANLRQTLKRLREAARADLVVGDDRLSLADVVAVDAVQLSTLAFVGEDEAVAARDGTLLEGFTFDEWPEFEEWLLATREELDHARREAAVRASARHEEAGRFEQAARFAHVALRYDPLSEEASRRVMRLHYLAGDRGAALDAYRRLQAFLQREFGAAPLPETTELARLIEASEAVAPAAPVRRRPLPLSVRRPPILVGRDDELRRMDDAFAARQLVFVRGAPGAGKTRLALDFARRHGDVVPIAARPGDRRVPFATYARAARDLVGAQPDLPSRLPPRARGMLARLLPELDEPILGEVDTLTFFEALGAVLRLAYGERTVIVVDDAQFMDDATAEVLAFLTSTRDGVGGLPPTVVAYRDGELPMNVEASFVEPLVRANLAVRVDVPPLPARHVRAMLAALDLPGAEELGDRLARFTGGNPLFVLETVRHLHDLGHLERGLPDRLPPPRVVTTVIEGRLGKLSNAALNVARVAAIFQSDFTPTLIARALGTDTLSMLSALEELEAAQVFEAGRFVHDLVYETVRAGITPEVARVLHARAAEVLEETNGNPARAAEHWEAAGEPLRAAPHLVQASNAADAASRLQDALEFARRAADIFAARQPSREFEARASQARSLAALNEPGALDAVTHRLLLIADTSERRAEALLQRAWYVFVWTSRTHEALDLVREGLALSGLSDRAHAELRQVEARANTRLGRLDDAQAALLAMRDLAARTNDPEYTLAATVELGHLVGRQGRHEAALAYFEEALAGLRRWGRMAYVQVMVLQQLAHTLLDLDRPAEALEHVKRAWEVHAASPSGAFILASLALTEARARQRLGDHAQALLAVERCLSFSPRDDVRSEADEVAAVSRAALAGKA